MIPNIYLSDEEMARAMYADETRASWVRPLKKMVAKAAADNVVKQVVGQLKTILDSECPTFKGARPFTRQSYRLAHIEEFVEELDKKPKKG